ncbi:MAG: hypothetical protein WCH62_02880 [Candidatus Omnitrophota bacterium]
MKSLLLLALVVLAGGCATSQVYNPVAAATQQTFLLNESSFAQVEIGMKQTQVHQIMGDTIIIGYAYQKPLSDEAVVLKASFGDYKPLTIANPYKTEEIKTQNGQYAVEYYASSSRQSDGILSNDELMPLIFHEGILVAKGWDYLKSLSIKNPS